MPVISSDVYFESSVPHEAQNSASSGFSAPHPEHLRSVYDAIFFTKKDMRNQINRGILQNRQPTIPKIANAQVGSLPVPPKSGPSRGIIKVKVPGMPTNLHWIGLKNWFSLDTKADWLKTIILVDNNNANIFKIKTAIKKLTNNSHNSSDPLIEKILIKEGNTIPPIAPIIAAEQTIFAIDLNGLCQLWG